MSVKKYLNQVESFKGRTIVLLGATSGIGLELIKHLVSKEAKIILLARNTEKANEIKKLYQENIIDIIEYDQSSCEKIDESIDELLNKHKDFDSIVLNAGVLNDKRILDNGYPATFGINYIGARYFINQISPKLNHKVRFVIQGSCAAGAKLNKPIDAKKDKVGMFKQYNISKGYLEAYFYKLYTDNKYPNFEYVLTEPGITSTNITRRLNPIVRVLGKGFLPIFFHLPKKASLTLLKGLSSTSKNGDYIIPRGLLTFSGLPKTKPFPDKRKREFLFK